MTYIAKQIDKNGFIDFTEQENKTWQTLIERQDKIIQGRACQEFIDGLTTLNMPRDRIPQCADINKILQECTGWSVIPVAALIPQGQFYQLLANRQFPAASFIRRPEDLDYLPEPDIFHELYGHCPLLTNQAYADFLQWYGENALTADKKGQKVLARLFWYTIEFGLFKIDEQFQIYGGGILSSKEETVYAIESNIPQRIPLDNLQALRTPYHYDEIQKLYFYIENFEELYKIQQQDLLWLLNQAHIEGDLEPGFKLC